MKQTYVNPHMLASRSGPMVSMHARPQSEQSVFEPWLGFLNSHFTPKVPLSTQVYIKLGWGNHATDWHPIQGEQEIALGA